MDLQMSMDLQAKIRTIPTSAGVYLYKNAEGEIIYVGKAKTYPYVKLTLGERFPRVYVTRRLRKDGSSYYGPYFPANLAYRIVDLIHRHFMVPSCKVDLTRYHPRPCLQ